MLTSFMTITAFEIALKFLEDDGGGEIFREVGIGTETGQRPLQSIPGWFGRLFAHLYPEHGLALAALACEMHLDPSPLSRY
jgi:hypothetical protein